MLDFYAAHEEFVAPANRFNEVKSFVERGLEDVSFSREKKAWGIPVPDDPNQVIYVWADALVNYITVVGGIEGWEQHPADIHMIAKDIARFHADHLAGDAYVGRFAVARDRLSRTDF